MENKKQKKPALSKDNKIKKLIFKLFIIFLTFFISLILLAFIINFILSKKNVLKNEIKSLNDTNNNILLQVKDIDNKSLAAKNYIKIWESDFKPEQKTLDGLNITEVTKQIQKIALKNKLANVFINFSPVINVQGDFEKKSIRTFTTLLSLKFSAISDINVYQFLYDIKNDLNYFVIIQEISLKRTKKIDDNFLKTLSSGAVITAVDGEIKIRLYGLGEK